MFIFAASGSADSQLGIIEIGRHTVGADSLYKVEIFFTDAVIVDEFFVDFTNRNIRGRGQRRRVVDLSADSLNQDISSSTFTGKGVDFVG